MLHSFTKIGCWMDYSFYLDLKILFLSFARFQLFLSRTDCYLLNYFSLTRYLAASVLESSGQPIGFT